MAFFDYVSLLGGLTLFTRPERSIVRSSNMLYEILISHHSHRKRSSIFIKCQKGIGRGTSSGKGCVYSEVIKQFQSFPPPPVSFSCHASLSKQSRMSNHFQSQEELLVRPRVFVQALFESITFRAVQSSIRAYILCCRDLLLKDRDLRETQDREALASVSYYGVKVNKSS